MKPSVALIFICLSLGVTMAYPHHVQRPQDANLKKAGNIEDIKKCFSLALNNFNLCLVTGITYSDWSSENWENIGFGKVLKSPLVYDSESEESESFEEEHEVEPSESESFEDYFGAGLIDQCFLVTLNNLVNCVSGGEYFL